MNVDGGNGRWDQFSANEKLFGKLCNCLQVVLTTLKNLKLGNQAFSDQKYYQ